MGNVPCFQKLRFLSYVEYFLFGCGTAYPASSQSQIPKWLGPGALAVESTARIVTCEKQRGVAAIEKERGDTGHMVLCSTCCDIQSRFVTAMPRRAKQAKRAKQDDLLGGDEASAAESGDEASTVSSDADHLSGSEAEAEREENKATTQLSALSAPAKIRPARQGMPASL